METETDLLKAILFVASCVFGALAGLAHKGRWFVLLLALGLSARAGQVYIVCNVGTNDIRAGYALGYDYGGVLSTLTWTDTVISGGGSQTYTWAPATFDNVKALFPSQSDEVIASRVPNTRATLYVRVSADVGGTGSQANFGGTTYASGTASSPPADTTTYVYRYKTGTVLGTGILPSADVVVPANWYGDFQNEPDTEWAGPWRVMSQPSGSAQMYPDYSAFSGPYPPDVAYIPGEIIERHGGSATYDVENRVVTFADGSRYVWVHSASTGRWGLRTAGTAGGVQAPDNPYAIPPDQSYGIGVGMDPTGGIVTATADLQPLLQTIDFWGRRNYENQTMQIEALQNAEYAEAVRHEEQRSYWDSDFQNWADMLDTARQMAVGGSTVTQGNWEVHVDVTNHVLVTVTNFIDGAAGEGEQWEDPPEEEPDYSGMPPLPDLFGEAEATVEKLDQHMPAIADALAQLNHGFLTIVIGDMPAPGGGNPMLFNGAINLGPIGSLPIVFDLAEYPIIPIFREAMLFLSNICFVFAGYKIYCRAWA